MSRTLTPAEIAERDGLRNRMPPLRDGYVTERGRPEAECLPHLVVREDGCWLVVGTRTIAVISAATLEALRAQSDVVTLVPGA